MGPLNPVAHGTILTFLPLNKNIYTANKTAIINPPPNASPKIRGVLCFHFFLPAVIGGGVGSSISGESDCGGDREGEEEIEGVGDGDGDGDGERKGEGLGSSTALRLNKDSSRLLTVLFSEDLKYIGFEIFNRCLIDALYSLSTSLGDS
jgi:hypothetical protein